MALNISSGLHKSKTTNENAKKKVYIHTYSNNLSAKMNLKTDMKSKFMSCFPFADYYTEIAQKTIHV